MNKPIIGIPSFRTMGEVLPRYSTTGHYIEQLERAGGIPVQLPLSLNTGKAQLEAWCKFCDGVLLPGGGDLNPLLSHAEEGEPPVGWQQEFDYKWQCNELELTRMAVQANIPLLGICLGMQVINVALGGTLLKDIPAQVPNAIGHSQDPRHRELLTHAITVFPHTKLAELSGCADGGMIRTNSFHHQAVDGLAQGLVVVARAEDGIIEAIEKPGKEIIGVQWHPENFAQDRPEAFALFQWLVAAAQRTRGTK